MATWIFYQEPWGSGTLLQGIAGATCKKITGALTFALGEVNTMPASVEARLAALEKAALLTEGAQFALHDLVAQMLARIPTTDLNTIVASLTAHAADLDAGLGPDRVAGYRNELASIADEVAHVRGDAQGLLARLVRVVGTSNVGRG